MHKRLFMLAALLALFALSTLAGHAFASTTIEYRPSPDLVCNGAASWETMAAQLNNTSGATIHIKRWYDTGSGKSFVDTSSWPLANNTADAESYKRKYPTNLVAVGWDVDEMVGSSVYLSNQSDSCGF